MKLIKRKEIEKPNIVYNLEVENDHNYIVENAVVANCHLATGNTLKSLLTSTFAKIQLRWGLTGTIPKEEHAARSLLVSIGPVVGELPAHELQDQGVLSSCNVNVIQMEDYAEYSDYKAELKYQVTTEGRLDFMVNKIREIAKTGNTFVLVDRKVCGEYLTANLEGSLFVSGKIKVKNRKEIYEEINFADNSITIATYGVASTGINITKLENLVLIEPGKSFVRVIQSIGRGLRKGMGKDHVEIYDICSTMKFSKRHLTARKKFYSEAQYPFNISKVKWQ